MPEAQHSKKAYSQLFLKKIRHLLAAQSPQGLKRCADAQHFFIRRNVVPEAQHSKKAYSQLFLKKIRHLLLLNRRRG